MPHIVAHWRRDGSPSPSVVDFGRAKVAAALAGKRVLLVEDEFIVARDIALKLGERGAIVVGPAATVEAASRALAERVDCAIVDIDLRGNRSYEVADRLMGLGIPFLFSTGFDSSLVPARFSRIVVCEKPDCPVEALARLVSAHNRS